MRATIRDPLILSKVGPLDLAAYLRTRGWTEQERTAGRFSIWTLGRNGDSFEVLLPLDVGFRDYALRIGELLRTLELVEDRSQLELLADVATSFADLIRVRALADGAHDGRIGLDAGLELMRNAREMMLAAACAAIEPRPHYPSRKPDRAMEYLASLEMGQTERGSYVLSILSPVPPALQGSLFPDAEEPFERRVTRTLAEAATAARDAAEESAATGQLEPFQRAVQRGVSANLCDALSGLHQAGGGDRLDLGVSWASARRADVSVPAVIHFTRDAANVLREASRIFKETGAETDFELLGYVIGLKREEGAETGTVTVSGLVDGSLRKVRMELSGAAYERAIEAHKCQQLVRCEGELARESRVFILREPYSFTIAVEE